MNVLICNVTITHRTLKWNMMGNIWGSCLSSFNCYLFCRLMKRFKPFTPSYNKKAERSAYWYHTMTELAEINWETVDLKEKYWRMDASYSGYSTILEETMDDYEALSEESCMYCNKHCKQYWTHEDSWLIHLCLPCLIGDKITILLERIIRRWRKRNDKSDWYTSYTSA